MAEDIEKEIYLWGKKVTLRDKIDGSWAVGMAQGTRNMGYKEEMLIHFGALLTTILKLLYMDFQNHLSTSWHVFRKWDETREPRASWCSVQ